MNKDNRKAILRKCESIISSFNHITHSIDTHIEAELKGKLANINDSDKVFIQQIVYGWQRNKPALDAFINNFFLDNAALVARADKIMYIVFAYMVIFRLDELTFQIFKEFVAAEDPTKMFNFMSYIFNKEVLWSSLRADWIKVLDLSFVEDELIPGIEQFIPDAKKHLLVLQESAQGLAVLLAAKEEAKRNGTAGLGKVEVRERIQPVSPKLNRVRPPRVPEPILIPQNVHANEVPSNLNNITLADIEKLRKEQLETTRKITADKYSKADAFKLNETKGGRKIEDIRREVEEAERKNLLFDSSFVNPVPDFNNETAKVRLNVATILREDALYKKQITKDAQILRNYEEELRDPSEFYAWQKEMKERDEQLKLYDVSMRRELAKQSAEEAKLAIEKQKEDNAAVASMLREQAEAIKQQKMLEDEIRILANQELASAVIAVRDSRPKEAKELVERERKEVSKKVREELEAARQLKEEQDRLEEEQRADKIRQQRALNTVHKKHIVVFDPTETPNAGLMCEMSYMEMEERLEIERSKEAIMIESKKQEINEFKEKRANDIHNKSMNIIAARQTKFLAKQKAQEYQKEKERKELEMKEKMREAAALLLNKDLTNKRDDKARNKELLRLESEKIQRQQQYLGSNMSHVDEDRAEQLQINQERIAKEKQRKAKEESILKEEVYNKNIEDRKKFQVKIQKEKLNLLAIQDIEAANGRREALEKAKEEYFSKKNKVSIGHQQHEKTKQVVTEHNLYATKITKESLMRSSKQLNK